MNQRSKVSLHLKGQKEHFISYQKRLSTKKRWETQNEPHGQINKK